MNKYIKIIEAHNHNWSIISGELYLLVAYAHSQELKSFRIKNLEDLMDGLGY